MEIGKGALVVSCLKEMHGISLPLGEGARSADEGASLICLLCWFNCYDTLISPLRGQLPPREALGPEVEEGAGT